MAGNSRAARAAAADIPRLHCNEWGVWHWKPEKRLRPAFKGRSLGRDEREAVKEAKKLNREAETHLARAAQPSPSQPHRPVRRTAKLTVSQLSLLWRLGPDGEGSDHWRGLRERTHRQFRYVLKVVEAEFGDDVAELVDRTRVKLWLDPLKRRTPSGARSYCVVARTLFSWAMDNGHIPRGDNPFARQKLPSVKKRPRYFSFEDIKHLVAVADGRTAPPPGTPGQEEFEPRPSIGTALVLAFSCVQRITDVLQLGTRDLVEKRGVVRLVFTQSKSQRKGQDFELEGGVRIDARLPPLATTRLEVAPPAATPRLNWQPLVVNETSLKPYSDLLASIRFAEIRKRAIACDPARWGHLAGMQLRDCRRSGFIHLRKLGLTVEQIVNLSGHTLKAGYAILEHYLPKTAEEADEVAAMMTGEL